MMGRPPPPRLPPNLPALQGIGNPPGGGGGPDNMGPRGSANGMGGVGAKHGSSNQGGADGGGGGGGPSINVYVGKLKPETDNALVQELLVCCGRVEKWNRAVDPSTDLPKAFGFCTYRNAQAAAVSVQVRLVRLRHVSVLFCFCEIRVLRWRRVWLAFCARVLDLLGVGRGAAEGGREGGRAALFMK